MRPAEITAGRGSITMRQVYLTLAGCMAVLLLGLGLLFVYDRAGYDLTLPDATDIQIDTPLSARSRQMMYQLPPNRTLNDVFVHLENHGWSRDRRAEQRLRRDEMSYDASIVAFTRQNLFGMLSEIALIRGIPTERRGVEIRIFRCFRLFSPNECF
jgi:hypothetical protein